MPLSAEERVLLEGCRDGDEKAWLALYTAYAGDVGRFLKGMLRRSDEIDDLVQKVFLELLSSLERFRGEAALRTWLHRIARHVALHDIRSRTRRSKAVRAYAESIDEKSTDPRTRFTARDRLEKIQALLSAVDETFREVWLLRELQGFSVSEAATILEIPEATVRTRHYRARQQLFKLVEALDEDELGEVGQTGLRLIWSKGGGS